MSRILLISSNITRSPFPVFPLGMAIIASSLSSEGHIVKQYDCLQEDADEYTGVISLIFSFKPDFIGISIRNIDNVDSLTSSQNWYLKNDKRLIKNIKKKFDIPIIIGGPAFSIMPEKILNYVGADYGIVGEGENSIKQLIGALSIGKEPERIISAQNLIDGNKFIAPLYEKPLADFYISESGMLNYQTKRGCPHGCNYCSYPIIEGKKFRKQDPEFVAENLKKIKRDLNINTVFFTDSVFNDSTEHYLKVAEEMIRQECNIKWAAYFRPDKITENNIKLLKASGLYAMELGSDAACDATLDSINKSFLFKDVLEFNRVCIKHEVPTAHFFMFGSPGETEKTVNESLKNIEELGKCVVFIFSGIRILPQTGIRNIAIEQGIISEQDDLLKPFYYFSPKLDKKKTEDRIKASFKKRKDRIFPPEEGQIMMNIMHRFGFRGIIWDKLVSFSDQRPMRSNSVSTMQRIFNSAH